MVLGIGESAREVLKIKTTLGDDAFLVMRMDVKEQLSRLPEYIVEVVGADMDLLGNAKDVDLSKLIGTPANVTFDLNDDPREFNAFVIKAQRAHQRGRYRTFTLQMRPWLWFATRTRNSQVFQAQSVKDIVTKVLTEYSSDFEFRLLSESVYPKLDYCVQYNETDFEFVSRLLEEAGIYYFFEHTTSKHTMVMIDAMAKHKSRKGKGAIKWANAMKSDATMINWLSSAEVRSVKAVVKDYDYLASKTEVKAEKAPTKPNKKKGSMEVFEYPADVAQNQIKPESQPATSAATQRASVLMESLVSQAAVSTGTTNARDLAVGMTFELDDAQRDDDDGHYMVTGANYKLEFADHEGVEDLKTGKRKDGFQCDLVCVSVTGPAFRPERVTPRPIVHGPQTAVVVGAKGNEIETDKHGRVKVQFHWDRLGKNDEKSSCWVRVAQFSAGKAFGLWSVPRIGQEVVVSFLGGDPDRPVITGAVYNDQNTIAYELPKLATVSGWRTHSSKEGAADMFNELRFEDLKEKEYVWIQAQRDFYRSVKENAFDLVTKNETVKVKLTRKEVIGENWYLDVTKDVMHNLGKDLHTKVAGDVFLTGGATYQIGITKELSVKAGADIGITGGAKLQIKATGDMVVEAQAIKMKSGSDVILEAGPGGSITLKAGGSTVVLGPSGVSVVGTMVKINSGGGGGSAGSASPKEPAEAKIMDELTSAKATDYDKLFEDPILKK